MLQGVLSPLRPGNVIYGVRLPPSFEPSHAVQTERAAASAIRDAERARDQAKRALYRDAKTTPWADWVEQRPLHPRRPHGLETRASRITSSSRSPQGALTWRPGYCGLAYRGQGAQCISSGSYESGGRQSDAGDRNGDDEVQGSTHEADADACLARCLRCPRCAYVSYSKADGDCSWFARWCALSRPHHPTFGMGHASAASC